MEWKQTEAYYLLSQSRDNAPVDYCDMAVRSIDVVAALEEIERQAAEIAELRAVMTKARAEAKDIANSNRTLDMFYSAGVDYGNYRRRA